MAPVQRQEEDASIRELPRRDLLGKWVAGYVGFSEIRGRSRSGAAEASRPSRALAIYAVYTNNEAHI
jgi:hypothetical protein